ncbi:MAG: OmpA family protein [Pseudomonadales bacterium]
MHKNSEITELRSETSKRYWIQRAQAENFFTWPAWLWLLGLLLLLIWGLFVTAPHIEQQVEQQVTNTLNNSKQQLTLRNVEVSADGQSVSVAATGSDSTRSLAESLGHGSQCATVFGELTCPTDVSIELKPAAQEPTTVIIKNKKAIAHNFLAKLSNEGLVIEGKVASEDTLNKISNVLDVSYPVLENKLTVSGKLSSGDDAWAASKAGGLLALAQSGKVLWQDGVLSATLLSTSENEAAIRAVFQDSENTERYGSLNLQLQEIVSRCDEAFSDLLKENSILFQTGSSVIAAESANLLDRIAKLAVDCNMGLDIEGHTDSVGAAEDNNSLSLSRANAVVDALSVSGVDLKRLTAYGFGSVRPIAGNDTAAGRKKNRRIEIRVSKIN